MSSIEFWFRVMDIDSDGILSLYEMEWFWKEQAEKIDLLKVEKIKYEDAVCQMYIRVNGKIRLDPI